MSAKLNTLNVIIIKLFIFINKREIGTHTTSRRDLKDESQRQRLILRRFCLWFLFLRLPRMFTI